MLTELNKVPTEEFDLLQIPIARTSPRDASAANFGVIAFIAARARALCSPASVINAQAILNQNASQDPVSSIAHSAAQERNFPLG